MEMRQRPLVGVFFLVVLVIQAACATGAPGRGWRGSSHPPPDPVALHLESGAILEVNVLETGALPTRVVAVSRMEFQQAVQQLGARLRLVGTPQETALRLFQRMPEEELLAEVYRGRVLSLVPMNETCALVPEEEAALRRDR